MKLTRRGPYNVIYPGVAEQFLWTRYATYALLFLRRRLYWRAHSLRYVLSRFPLWKTCGSQRLCILHRADFWSWISSLGSSRSNERHLPILKHGSHNHKQRPELQLTTLDRSNSLASPLPGFLRPRKPLLLLLPRLKLFPDHLGRDLWRARGFELYMPMSAFESPWTPQYSG